MKRAASEQSVVLRHITENMFRFRYALEGCSGHVLSIAHYFISANKTCRQPAAIVRHRSPGTVSKAGDYERGWSVMIRRLEIFHGAEVSPA